MSQKQQGGDGSINLQGDNVSLQVGSDLEEMRAIANDVFRANALELREIAEEVALARADKLIERFIEEFRKRDVGIADSLRDPDVQYGLYVAQESFARSGSEALGETLVDLLVERCSRDTGSFPAVVLNEALATVRKLTNGQVSALTVGWLVTKVVNNGLNSREALADWLRQHVWPFVADLPQNGAAYEHLQYAGCASVGGVGKTRLGRVFALAYPGLFARGLQLSEIPEELQPFQDDRRLFMPCMADPELLQVAALNEDAARAKADELGAPVEPLIPLLQRVIPEDDIVAWIQELDETGRMFVETWQGTPLHTVRVTTVGTAIGHSNWKRVVGAHEELEIWIPEH